MNRNKFSRCDVGLVALAATLALVLGFANLDGPSLWHDELVHVFVAKNVADTGWPSLPSGRTYVTGSVFNYLLAGSVAIFGDSETAVRAPSVLIAAVNVVLTFLVLQPFLGRPTALIAAFALALSPWSVAWSRQARLYAFQEMLYLLTLWAVWRAMASQKSATALHLWLLAGVCYLLAIFTSFHSILFLAPFGIYALALALYERRLYSRWTLALGLVAAVGLGTLVGYLLTFSTVDFITVFKEAHLGGRMRTTGLDIGRVDRYFYIRWLMNNLSTGYFLLALFGFATMTIKEGRRGLFCMLAFWTPVLVLTFLIGYRRPRFMYFAFPLYVAAFSYALVVLARFIATADRSWARGLAAALILAFAARLAVSTVRLVGDSLEAASGADTTLARRHPQWRGPCRYVRNHLDGAAVISTTYLPVLYYVGRIDDWYPSRFIVWEFVESGLDGLKTLEDLKGFVANHPRGFFLAEWQRFGRWRQLAEDQAWVDDHMKRIEEASSEDVIVYAWGGQG